MTRRLARLTKPAESGVPIPAVEGDGESRRIPGATDRRGSGVDPLGGREGHAVPDPAVRHA